jgi:hypothetical protein
MEQLTTSTDLLGELRALVDQHSERYLPLLILSEEENGSTRRIRRINLFSSYGP